MSSDGCTCGESSGDRIIVLKGEQWGLLDVSRLRDEAEEDLEDHVLDKDLVDGDNA